MNQGTTLTDQKVLNEVTLQAVVIPGKLNNDTNLNVDRAKALVITDNDQFNQAGEFLKVLKGLQKEVISTFATAKENAVKTHKSILESEKKHLAPLEEAEGIVKRKISDFYTAEQKRIADERRRLEDEERKRRVAEQERLAKEQKEREEQALKDAEALKAAGDHEAAEAIVNEVATETKIEPMQESIPVHVEETPKIKGVSTVTTWECDIIDPSKVNRAFLCVDEAKVRKTVKAMGKDAESLIGGIKVFQKTNVRSKS